MPNLRKMFLRWVVMVWTLEKRSLAISFVVLPWAMARTIAASVSVRMLGCSYDAELVGGVDHAAQELWREFVADENPVRQVEALGDNQQLVLVGEVEQRVVEQYYGILVLPQQVHQHRLVVGLIHHVVLMEPEQAFQRKP